MFIPFPGYGQDRAVRTNGKLAWMLDLILTIDLQDIQCELNLLRIVPLLLLDFRRIFTRLLLTQLLLLRLLLWQCRPPCLLWFLVIFTCLLVDRPSTTNQFSSSSWWSWSTTGSTWSFISSSSSSSGITSQDSEADYCFSVYFGTCEDLPSFTSCASVDTTCHNTASLTTVSSSPSITFSNDALVANGIISFKQVIACSGEGLGYNGYSTPDCGSHASFYTMEEFYNMAGVTSSNSNLDEFASGQCTSVSTSMAIDMFFPFCGQTFSSQSYWPSFYNAGCLASPSVVALVAFVVVLSL